MKEPQAETETMSVTRFTEVTISLSVSPDWLTSFEPAWIARLASWTHARPAAIGEATVALTLCRGRVVHAAPGE